MQLKVLFVYTNIIWNLYDFVFFQLYILEEETKQKERESLEGLKQLEISWVQGEDSRLENMIQKTIDQTLAWIYLSIFNPSLLVLIVLSRVAAQIILEKFSLPKMVQNHYFDDKL